MSEIELRLDQAIEELKEIIEYLLNSLVTGIADKKDTTEKIIVDGRFVLPGTEELNEAFMEN